MGPSRSPFHDSMLMFGLPRNAERPAVRTAGMLSVLQGSRRQLAHHGTLSPRPSSPHQVLVPKILPKRLKWCCKARWPSWPCDPKTRDAASSLACCLRVKADTASSPACCQQTTDTATIIVVYSRLDSRSRLFMLSQCSDAQLCESSQSFIPSLCSLYSNGRY